MEVSNIENIEITRNEYFSKDDYENNEHTHRQHTHKHHHKHHSHNKIKKNRALQLTLVILACLAILLVMAFTTYKILNMMGASSLVKNATSLTPEMTSKDILQELDTEEKTDTTKTVTVDQTLKSGEVLYNGKKYAYNTDIRTFLIMGIDTKGNVSDLLDAKTGGQSDMLFLAVIDQREKAIKMIGINRNTMTEVQECDSNLHYYQTVVEQITLQHAYGTGGSDSCEKTVAAVDNLMYMIPIHGYFAMNMGAISLLNDAVGGIELTALESIESGDIKFTEGEKVTLLGEKAFVYTKYRDWKSPRSADRRLERQKQYMTAFMKKTMSMVKNDLSIPLNLYNIVGNYSVTDITIDEISYLVSKAVNYSFNADSIYSLPGETIHPENTEYEEFWVDEDGLYDMIINIFYDEVEE